jgi:hypothetical protein
MGNGEKLPDNGLDRYDHSELVNVFSWLILVTLQAGSWRRR